MSCRPCDCVIPVHTHVGSIFELVAQDAAQPLIEFDKLKMSYAWYALGHASDASTKFDDAVGRSDSRG